MEAKLKREGVKKSVYGHVCRGGRSTPVRKLKIEKSRGFLFYALKDGEPGPLNQRNPVSVLQQRTIEYIRFLQTELYGTFNSVVHTPHSSC